MKKKLYTAPQIMVVKVKAEAFLAGSETMPIGSSTVTNDNQVFSRHHNLWEDDKDEDW